MKDVRVVAAKMSDEVMRNAPASDAERMARGIREHGWHAGARCSYCGDRGRYPFSGDYCTHCQAGARHKSDDEATARMERLERAWIDSGVPRRFLGYRLATSPTPDAARDAVSAWVGQRPYETGRNLVIVGAIGSGKTGLGISALRELHESGVRALRYVSAPRLFDSMRPDGDGIELPAALAAAVLMLDDLGASKVSEFQLDRMFLLLNGRYEYQRPTIVTTNVTAEALSAAIGERSLARLVEDFERIVLR